MFACSEGGHFTQLMALHDLFGVYDSILVTDNFRASKEMPELKDIGRIEFVGGFANARKSHAGSKYSDNRITYFLGYLKLFIECRKVIKRVRPKVLISTGSNIAVPLFFCGKLMGTKLIYIESRARVYTKSMTGKLVSGISDKVIVQWKEMLELYKNAEYYGVLV